MRVFLLLLIILTLIWAFQSPARTNQPNTEKHSRRKRRTRKRGLFGWLARRRSRGQWERAPAADGILLAGLQNKTEHLQAILPHLTDSMNNRLASPSRRDTKAFGQTLADFCEAINFDPTWIAARQLEHNPALNQAVEETLLLFSLAYWNSQRLQDNISLFNDWLAWQEKPGNKKTKTLSGEFYGHLVDQELTPAPPPDLFLVAEEERQRYIERVIFQAAEEYGDVFFAALAEANDVEPLSLVLAVEELEAAKVPAAQ